MDNSKPQETASQFLIAEYNSLQQRANSYEEIKSKRVNFFLLVIAAAGAVYSTIIGDKTLSSYIYEFTILFSLFSFILGFLTLKMLIDYSIAIVVFHRRAARVRKWFIDKNEELNNYVAFEANDDKPSFTMSRDQLYWRGAESILLLINSLSVGIIIATFLYQTNIGLHIIISSSFVIGVLIWFLQVYYTERRLDTVNNSKWATDNINFPSQKIE